MAITPVILDSRPDWLTDTDLTLLQLPVGRTLLLAILRDEAIASAGAPPLVMAAAIDGAGDSCTRLRRVVAQQGLSMTDWTSLKELVEPTDWLLLMSAGRYPLWANHITPAQLSSASGDPRRATRFAASDHGEAPVDERILVDANGHVRRIQRLYRGVTALEAVRGVGLSISGAALSRLGIDQADSLEMIEAALKERLIPSSDVLLSSGDVDRNLPEGLLDLNFRVIEAQHHAAAAHGNGTTAGAPEISPQADVAASARLVGAVVVQAGAVVGEGAVIIGPAVIGREARVGRGARICRLVVSDGAEVPPNAVLRDSLVLPRRVIRTERVVFLPPDSAAGPAVAESDGAGPRWYRGLKRAMDIFVAAIALLALSPVMLVIAAAVKVTSRGPALYGDLREGHGGRPFRCWKFRSMSADAAAQQRKLAMENEVDGPQFKIKCDRRVTALGRILRATNLDELPQLINVVSGSMSLIGPRPSPFRENQICVPWRQARLSVRPGITGLWQMCRRDRVLGDFHQWIYFDLLYVRRLSPMLDLRILVATILTLGGRWPVPLKWLIPDTESAVPDAVLPPRYAPILEMLSAPRLRVLPEDCVQAWPSAAIGEDEHVHRCA